MIRIALATLLLAGVFDACTCGDSPRERDSTPERRSVASETGAVDPALGSPGETAVEMERAALAEELARHADASYSMPARSVPEWFFRPTTDLQRFLPDGDLYAWEAQFDCSSSNAPACNLNYEVKMQGVSDVEQVYERAAGLSELGFRVVKSRPPSLKAVRPVERSTAVEVLYLNRPGDEDVWMSVTLRQPVNPEVTRMLAQKRFWVLADFAVEFVRLPYSLSIEKGPYEEKIAYAATYDLSESLRGDVESYLRANEFELETKGAVEAKTSVWTHPSGWRVSLEGGESSFRRFMVYFSASGHVAASE